MWDVLTTVSETGLESASNCKLWVISEVASRWQSLKAYIDIVVECTKQNLLVFYSLWERRTFIILLTASLVMCMQWLRLLEVDTPSGHWSSFTLCFCLDTPSLSQYSKQSSWPLSLVSSKYKDIIKIQTNLENRSAQLLCDKLRRINMYPCKCFWGPDHLSNPLADGLTEALLLF